MLLLKHFILPRLDAGAAFEVASVTQLDRPGLAMMEGVKGRAVLFLLSARAQPLSALADQLSEEFRMPILDQTGLTGRFDFTLEFVPQVPGALTPDSTDRF
jgi:uncharacterized protein (TIGR03435 family)